MLVMGSVVELRFAPDQADFGTICSRMPTVEVSVSAGKEAVSTPWISTLCRDFELKIRIVKANVDTDFGWLQLQFEGPVEEIQRATAWLMTTGMHIQTETRALGAT